MRHVCLLGTSELTWHKAPLADPSVEKWGIASGYHLYGEQCDRLFELHFDEPGEVSGIDASFWMWAPTCRIPIYMISARPDVPASVEYPIDDVIDALRSDYFTSTVALMLALAIYEHVDRISLYGIDLSNTREYAFERPCAEYWIGKFQGLRGDDAVHIARGSFITRAKEIYGFRRPSAGYELYAPTNFGENSCVLNGIKIDGMRFHQFNSAADKDAAIARAE